MTKSQQEYDFQNQKINPLLYPIRIAYVGNIVHILNRRIEKQWSDCV